MVNLHFIVNKRVIAAHLIQNSDGDRLQGEGEGTDLVVSFQNYAWEKDKKLYGMVWNGMPSLSYATSDGSAETIRNINSYLDEISDSELMHSIVAHTEQACEKVRTEWEQNLEKSSAIIADIMVYHIDGNWNVYVSHPAVKTGANMHGEILWTHRSDWPNYNTVYVWHEILHSEFGHTNQEHAIIELIDNELRARLNNIEYPPFEGHDFLEGLRQELLPAWREYLASESKDIKEFTEKILYKE